nr:unnamed protein product [Callosobruchus chinensis]
MKEKHCNSVAPASSKLYRCKKCIYITRTKDSYRKHLLKHPKTAGLIKPTTCIHCNAEFRSQLSHDDHVVKKHPGCIKSVTRKLHSCTECPYQTIIKSNFDKHVSIHSKTTTSDFSKCIYCDAMFKNKVSVDDHIVKNHPNFISSVARKIYECTECTYKTVQKSILDAHMSKHSSSGYERFNCMHCKATFKFKISCDDHVVQKHPEFIKSLSTKIYECTECNYKTTLKYKLGKHMLVHPESHSSYELGTCTHCSAVFKSEKALDEHVVREHPKFIKSLERKIYRCTECIYKTVFKYKFERHMSAHPETDSS